MNRATGALSIPEVMEQALRHHREGKLQAAESLYREVLRIEPQNAEALHLLGVIAYQVKRHEAAVELARHAIAVDGTQGHFHNALAMALMALGRREEAIASYRRAIELQPGLGEAHNNLGNALREQGRLDEAAACYRQALALNPGIVEAHNNLGNVLKLAGDVNGAIACYQKALALRPSYGEAFSNLAVALEEQGRLEEAVECARRAISLNPDFADAHGALGNALNKLGRLDEALAAHRRAVGLQPGSALAHSNLGVVLFAQGRVDEALASYERALERDPALAPARWNRSIARLMKQEYAEGWQEYEWRWQGCPWMRSARLSLPLRRWEGEPLKGKRLLVYAEQGLGDEIMFASVLPELIREADACFVECSPRLAKLFRRSFPGAVAFGNDRSTAGWQQRLANWIASQGAVDLQTAVGSLPLYRRRSLADFPRHRGYLKADARRVSYWKTRLAKLGAGLKVGISWRGGRALTGMARRSMGFGPLAPLLGQRGLRFVSLQYGDCTEELARLAEESGIVVAHWQEALEDYDETAALVKALDIVLSVCTAVVHLGGALGQRTWVMAPNVPEWRYGLIGETMPWYPSVRIFRQPAPGDWESVVRRVHDELRQVKR